MFRRILTVALVFAAVVVQAEEKEKVPKKTGAKALFYDPSDRSVVEVEVSEPKARAENNKLKHDDSGVRLAKPASQVQTAPLGLRYWVELVEGPGSSSREVTSSRVFRSGERIRLHFRTNSDGHIAILQISSSGTSSYLFPDPSKELSDSFVRANEECAIPSEKATFRFDDNPGEEWLIVMFARDRADLGRQSGGEVDSATTTGYLRAAENGSKDLFIETETEVAGEIGEYVVDPWGKPITMVIKLDHR